LWGGGTAGLKRAGLGGAFAIGNTSKAVCEIAVALTKIGMILIGGLNPVAADEEAGVETKIYTMSTVMEYRDLVRFQEVVG